MNLPFRPSPNGSERGCTDQQTLSNADNMKSFAGSQALSGCIVKLRTPSSLLLVHAHARISFNPRPV